MMAAGTELDRVGYDLPADERGAHPFRAHGDAVGHRDGVELHRRAPGVPHPGLDVFGQAAQVEVARPDLNPRIGDADERLAQVFVGEAHRLEHRPGGGAARAVGEAGAAVLERQCAHRLSVCRPAAGASAARSSDAAPAAAGVRSNAA